MEKQARKTFWKIGTFAGDTMSRILAIDYGQKRTGLAVTDDLQMIAGALATVPSSELIGFLKRYTRENSVACFVVGEARQMNNQPSESARFIEPFVKTLCTAFPEIPVERMDERFTSRMAQQAILFTGAKKKTRQDKALIDSVSATILLQSFMEMQSFQK